MMFAKLSILLLYLRISPSRAFRWTIYTLMIIAAGGGIGCIVASVCICSPVKAAWVYDGSQSAHCIHRPTLYYATAGLNIFTDVAILLTPIKMVMELNLPRRQKVGAMVVFLTGGFVCIVSILRLYSVHMLQGSPDLTCKKNPLTLYSLPLTFFFL
jgi:hypothetical protein